MEEARFSHPDSHGRGNAERIEHRNRTTVHHRRNIHHLRPGFQRVATARGNAGARSRIRYRYGTRMHTSASSEVPALYTPWITFPDRRRAQDGAPHPFLRNFGQRRNEPDGAPTISISRRATTRPSGPDSRAGAAAWLGGAIPLSHRAGHRRPRSGSPPGGPDHGQPPARSCRSGTGTGSLRGSTPGSATPGPPTSTT